MKISSVASILVASLSATGAVGGYFIFKPNNLEGYLKWKGYSLVNQKENENLWKSIYEDNKNDFSNDFSPKEGVENWKVIKDYCVSALKKSNYSEEIGKAIKWCLNNIKTVKGQMVKEGIKLENLMSKIEQYKVASLFQGNNEFWNLVGAIDDKLDNRANAYKDWCEKSLKSNPNSSLVKNVNTFCNRKPYSKFKEKLEFDKYVRLTKEEIKEKYKKLNLNALKKNTGSNLLEAIGEGSEKWQDNLGLKKEKDFWKIEESKFEEQYKKYCDSKESLDFSDEKNNLQLFSEYKGICAKPTGTTI